MWIEEMSSKVSCAIIGAGWWGTTADLPALVRHPREKVCCVHHRDATVVKEIAAEFNIPAAAAELDDVLNIDGLSAAIVSSAAVAHYHQAKACLERGLHVLIEKPMTIRAAEARELVELAERKGVQFFISAPFHYIPHAVEAKRLVESGALGQIKLISVLYTNFTAGVLKGLTWSNGKEKWRFAPREVTGSTFRI